MTLNAKAIAVAVVAVVAALLLWNAGVAYGRYQAGMDEVNQLKAATTGAADPRLAP
jgi:hypothetical protein